MYRPRREPRGRRGAGGAVWEGARRRLGMRRKMRSVAAKEEEEKNVDSKEKGVSRKLKSKDIQASDSPKKSRSSNARKRTRFADLYDDIEAQYSVVERAERVLEHLENELPHFVKYMLPSNVAHGFWLHLPKNFCSKYLPKHDTSIVLVDEWGNEYTTSYLLDRHGLSAGWRGFSISHRLLKGDILFFHLSAPCKLKVENVNGKNSILNSVADHRSNPFCSDMIEKGHEITNWHQMNDLCYPETSFLRDHAHEGVTRR
ncbi:B3 domain-containing protein-like protein isoform X3 [Salvia divinorum]|uniref:B3 domain-containing protein-like protein isoform X3 n=1 Tax=Salvia divinorum TaxID=28513 RepID=A0ABD1FS23_SALDI